MAQYLFRSPGSVERVEDLKAWCDQEFQSISQAMADTDVLQLTESFSPPKKPGSISSAIGAPRNGMLVFADGTKWDPGAGRGLYFYRDGSWRKLTGS